MKGKCLKCRITDLCFCVPFSLHAWRSGFIDSFGLALKESLLQFLYCSCNVCGINDHLDDCKWLVDCWHLSVTMNLLMPINVVTDCPLSMDDGLTGVQQYSQYDSKNLQKDPYRTSLHPNNPNINYKPEK